MVTMPTCSLENLQLTFKLLDVPVRVEIRCTCYLSYMHTSVSECVCVCVFLLFEQRYTKKRILKETPRHVFAKRLITAIENRRHQTGMLLSTFGRASCSFARWDPSSNSQCLKRKKLQSHQESHSCTGTYKNRGVFNRRKPPCSRGKTSSRK